MKLEEALKILNLKSLSGLSHVSLKNLYKKLAKEKHPDQGGTSSDFVLLREAYLFLLTQVSQEENSIAKTGETDIRSLSKEELLDRYYQDTDDLKSTISSYQLAIYNQVGVLDNVREKIEEVSSEFDKTKEGLKQEFESKVAELEKSFTPGFFKKIFFFLPKMKEDEFWDRYYTYVDLYSKKNNDLDNHFFKNLLSIYGDGLNDIAGLTQPKVD